MAFQAGSQVRPELGRIDYSGFTQAAGIEGQALANLGAMIGGAIAVKKAKKQQSALTEAQAATMFNLAEAMGVSSEIGMESIDDAKTAVKALGPKMTMDLINSISGAMAGPEPLDPVRIKQFDQLFQEGGIYNYIEFDEETGMAQMDGKPIPAEIRNIPGFNQYEALQRKKTRRTDFGASGMQILPE